MRGRPTDLDAFFADFGTLGTYAYFGDWLRFLMSSSCSILLNCS